MSVKKLIAPAVGAVIVVAGGLAAYQFLFKGGLKDASSPLASAEIVPDEAPLATFISMDSQGWAELQKFGTPEAQKLVGSNLNSFKSQLLAGSELNFDQDLKPWMGGLMATFVPAAQGAPAEQSQLLMVVGVKDKLKAQQFANKLKEDKTLQTKETDYKGVKITESTRNSTKLYSALLGDHLALSPSQTVVQQAVDTFKGEPSLADAKGARQTLSRSVDLPNSIAQVYITDYAAAIQQLSASNPGAPLPASTLEQLKQVKSVVMGVGVDDDGLRIKALTQVDPKAVTVKYETVPGKVISEFPAETIALVSGQGLKTLWTGLVNQAETDPATQTLVTQVRQNLQMVNLDADKEVFGWMDGEFALGAIAANEGVLAPFGAGAAMVLQTSDRATAEATLKKLDTLAQGNFLTIGQKEVNGIQVTEWRLPQQTILGHGWLDNNSIFIAMGDPLIGAIAAKPEQPLDSSPNFKAATASLPKPNAGYFYVNMDSVMTLLDRSIVQPQQGVIPPNAKAVLTSIRGVGVTATWPEKGTSELEMLVSLKPTSEFTQSQKPAQ